MSRLKPQSTRLVPRDCFTLASRTVLSITLNGKDLILDDANQVTYYTMDDAVDINLKSASVAGDVVTVLATLPFPAAGTAVTGSLCQSGDTVYFLNTTEDLFEVDVTNPAAPALLSTTNLGGNVSSSMRSDGADRLYEVNSGNLLRIIDISVPGAPVILSSTDLSNGALFAQPLLTPWSVAIDNTTLYVISNNAAGSWLAIYDVSNPLAIVQLGSIFIGGLSATDPSFLKVLQGLVHKVAYFVHDLRLFSVTVEDPTNLQILSNNTVDAAGFTNLDGLGQRLMLTNTSTKLLRVFNATQPASPVPMDSIVYPNIPIVPVMNINRVYVVERLP